MLILSLANVAQRDSEQRETLSTTIRTLRAEALQQTTKYERLEIKQTESQRKLGLAEGAERALKTQLRSAEQAAKTLREEMARMRILVGQTRSACANEVRKRERMIENLKKHVGEGGRARGSGKVPGHATITIVPGIGAEEYSKPMALDESGYDLRSETNQFLTELASGLSAENENLGALMRTTFQTLKDLSGWDKDTSNECDMVVESNTSLDALSADMAGVIEHLRTLLTNPSFVPLEEVEIREEEIQRLREGWERMEGRWREAVQMMDGWRKRMAKSGQAVNLEELNAGLKLSPLKEAVVCDSNGTAGQRDPLGDEYEEGDTQADIDAMDDTTDVVNADGLVDLDSDEESSAFADYSAGEGAVASSEEVQTGQEISFTTESSSPGTPPQMSPLREADGNRNHNAFTTIIEENTWDLAQLENTTAKRGPVADTLGKEASFELSPVKIQLATPQKTSSLHLRQPSGSSRLPRPAAPMAQQSPLTMATIAAKLAATEREADAARVRAKLKAAKLSTAVKESTMSVPTSEDKENIVVQGNGKPETVPTKQDDGPSNRKRRATTKIGGRATRRRSTLSPWELESLIQGEAVASPVK